MLPWRRKGRKRIDANSLRHNIKARSYRSTLIIGKMSKSWYILCLRETEMSRLDGENIICCCYDRGQRTQSPESPRPGAGYWIMISTPPPPGRAPELCPPSVTPPPLPRPRYSPAPAVFWRPGRGVPHFMTGSGCSGWRGGYNYSVIAEPSWVQQQEVETPH